MLKPFVLIVTYGVSKNLKLLMFTVYLTVSFMNYSPLIIKPNFGKYFWKKVEVFKFLCTRETLSSFVNQLFMDSNISCFYFFFSSILNFIRFLH